MADSLAIDFDEIRREIGMHIDIGRSSYGWTSDQIDDVESIMKEGFRDFFFALNPVTGKVHRWSFLYSHATITTTEPYSTGTVTIVSGVVTLSVAGTFPSWAAQGELQVDGTTYDISTRDGDNQVTLIDTTIDADALSTYIVRQVKYDLPSDFAALDGPVTYGPQNEQTQRQLIIIDEGDIRMMRATRTQTAWPPTYCALIPKTFDATTGQRYQLFINSPANAVYVLWYRYQKNPLTVDSTDKYPFGGPQHARTILYAVLAASERKLQDAPSVYAEKFQEAIVASIDFDQRTAAPDYPSVRHGQEECSHFGDRSGLACGSITNSL